MKFAVAVSKQFQAWFSVFERFEEEAFIEIPFKGDYMYTGVIDSWLLALNYDYGSWLSIE